MPTRHSGQTGTEIEPRVTDLAATAALAVVAAAAVLLEWPTPVRAPLAVVAVLFLPGYSLTAALFPAGPARLSGDAEPGGGPPTTGITLLERLVLSVGLSLAAVPPVGLVLGHLGAIRPVTLLSVVGLTLLAVPVAAVRRRSRPATDRYAPALDLRELRPEGLPDLVTVLLAASLVFAGGALAYTGSVGDEPPPATEFYFLAPGGDGEPRAGDYPREFAPGESRPLTVAVANAGGERTEYAVVGQLQRVESGPNGTVVRERRRIDSHELTLGPDGQRRITDTVTLRTAATDRVVYLLYEGELPAEPRAADAYREIHLWIDVGDDAGAGAGIGDETGSGTDSTAGVGE